MRNWTMAFVPLALAMTTAGCNGSVTGSRDGAAGNGEGKVERTAAAGPQVTKTYALTGFTGVELAGPDDITIRRGDAFSITAKGPQAEIDLLEVELDGATLSVGRKREGLSFSNRDDDGVEIMITMPRLDKLRLTGSGEIEADTADGDAVEAVVTGSGDLKVAKLTAKTVKIAVSGSGDIEIGGGTAGTGDYSVTGSGNIDADALAADTLDISITGSGDVEANASGAADVNILGSGDVEIRGGATCSTRAMGSGTATCK